MSSNIIYSSPACSCTVCRKQYSAKGIHSHFLTNHCGDEVKQKICGTRLRGKRINKTPQQLAADIKITEYNKNPSLCKSCNAVKPYKNRKNQYCSHSCAAKETNKLKVKSDATRNKISASIAKFNDAKHKEQEVPVTYILWCVQCCRWFPAPSKTSRRKTCSDICYKQFHSQRQSKTLRERHANATHRFNLEPKSWMEKSFEAWLLNNNIHEYDTEVKVYNTETGRYYYLDFVFPSKNIVIELDGTQHRKTIEYDKLRDDYILKTTGMTVIRVTASEFKKQTKIPLIKSLLGIQ